MLLNFRFRSKKEIFILYTVIVNGYRQSKTRSIEFQQGFELETEITKRTLEEL